VENTEQRSSVTGLSETRKTPSHITVCHYESGKLTVETKRWGEFKYIALSHIWGQVKWRPIPIFADEVIISGEKPRFLTNQLPSIIGNDWFWMDILCIDQRNAEARVAVTQYIPEIFRCAKKTLVVRESTGIRYCCNQIMEIILQSVSAENDKSTDISQALPLHYLHKPSHLAPGEDGILTRLWPLQEILLSDDLHFVRCEGKVDEEDKLTSESDEHFMVGVLQAVAEIEHLSKTWKYFGLKVRGDEIQR